MNVAVSSSRARRRSYRRENFHSRFCRCQIHRTWCCRSMHGTTVLTQLRPCVISSRTGNDENDLRQCDICPMRGVGDQLVPRMAPRRPRTAALCESLIRCHLLAASLLSEEKSFGQGVQGQAFVVIIVVIEEFLRRETRSTSIRTSSRQRVLTRLLSRGRCSEVDVDCMASPVPCSRAR